MKRAHSVRGTTLIETVIGAALLIVVIGAAAAMAKASTDVQQSTNDATTAAMRADRALQLIAEKLRKGSLATLRRLDDSTFADGTSDVGFKIQAVTGYTTAPVLAPQARYNYVVSMGAPDGSLVETQNGVSRVIVNGVTAFTVTRSGQLFTIDITTRSGPTDARARTVHATLQAASRNP
jgi:type II secretory pathway pseudopilin PulG